MDRFGLKDEVVPFIVEKAETLALEKVILFGSRAKGNYSEKSDIDLALSGQNTNAFIAELEDGCPTLLSFDFVNLSEEISPQLKDRILSEGVVLYG